MITAFLAGIAHEREKMRSGEQFRRDVLSLFDEFDMHDSLWWRAFPTSDYPEPKFFLNVNDYFAPSADLEEIEPDCLPKIRQAIEDCQRADPDWICTYEALTLWACRKRGCGPWRERFYPKNERLRPLWLAAGKPVRIVKLEQP